jgi:hypothetical protein
MRLSNIAYAECALAIGVALTMPIPAYAQVGAQPTYNHNAHVRHFTAIPRTATALMAAPAATVRAPETEGLGRNADDCAKFGCIDH